MSGFSSFIQNFCFLSVASGIVSILAPSEKYRRYIGFIISLVLVSALLSPIITFTKTLPDTLDKIEESIGESAAGVYKEVYSEITDTTRENLEREISTLICSRYGFESTDVLVIATLDTEDISAVNITDITVFLGDVTDGEAVREYLSDLFLNQVEINILKKGE